MTRQFADTQIDQNFLFVRILCVQYLEMGIRARVTGAPTPLRKPLIRPQCYSSSRMNRMAITSQTCSKCMAITSQYI